MIALPWRNLKQVSRRFSLLIGPLIAVALLIASCNRTSPATPAPIAPKATAAATAKSTTPSVTTEPTFQAHAPVPTSTAPVAIANAGTIFSSPRYSYTIVLPCCWMALPTAGGSLESAKTQAQAKNEMPQWGDLGESQQEKSSGAVLELIALLPDKKNVALPIAQMTVSLLPTHGLTLDKYLGATARELKNIANTELLTSTIDPKLGVGALPASVIEYKSLPTPASGESGKTIAGLQVAFFGQDADTLIVLTFTTTIDLYDQLKPEFLHIVRSVTLNQPSV